MEDQADIERARGIIRRLRIDIEDAIGCRVFFEAGNTAEAVAAFEEGKGHMPILIRSAMLQRWLFTMMRMHDSSPGADSLVTLSGLLTPTARTAMLSPSSIKAIERTTKMMRELRKDNRSKRLSEYRSKALAHTSMSEWPNLDRPAVDDLLGLSRDTEQLIEDLAAAADIATVRLSAVETIWRERAEAYWQRLIDTGPEAVEASE
ncbi:MAG: hypothetical protein MI920_18105 [Kiloniellales bacterium]|nr:hypothetical protein [Kiloniellales bacterium]